MQNVGKYCKTSFYEEVDSDPSTETKTRQDILVGRMLAAGEITEKVSDFLSNGGSKLPKFYHLLKTHNIPVNLADPRQWLEEQGFPIRDHFWSGGANRKTGRID